MKIFSKIFPGRLFKPSGFIGVVMILIFGANAFSQSRWALSTSVTFNSGDYIYQQRTNNYYFNTGLSYMTQKWSVSVLLPFILQNSSVYNENSDGSGLDSQHRMPEQTVNHLSNNYETGIGDLYFYGEYQALKASVLRPAVSISAQFKVPTANRLTLFSTGQFDYGLGLVLRKWVRTFNAFAELSYLKIGDPQEIDYQDPLAYGLGIGKYFASGKYSASFYFKGYSQIISGVDPPRQMALGFFTMLSNQTFLSFYLTKGLSESSPDFGLSSGIDWKL